jgi:O-antigen/teichoic acid export membrane protein
MKRFVIGGFFSVGLKAISILVKFILITLLMKELTLDDYANYSLMTITTGISIFFLGGDFYNYTQKQLSNKDTSVSVGCLIFNHAVVVFTLSLVFIVLSAIYFFLNDLGLLLFILFIFITLFEFFTTEAYRYAVYFERVIESNIILFLKSTLWVFIALGLYYFDQGIRLNLIYFCWAIGVMLTSAGCIFFYSKHFKGILNQTISLPTIKSGLIFSSPFLLAALLYKSNEFLDRYFIQQNMSLTELGVYSAFYTFVGVIQTFVFVGVVARRYPILLKSSCLRSLNKSIINFFTEISVLIIFLSSLVYYLFDFYAIFVGKKELIAYKDILLTLLIGNYFFMTSLVWHYVILKSGKGKFIFISTIIALSTNLILLFYMIPINSLLYVSYCFVISSIVLFICKFYFASISMKQQVYLER